MPKLRGSRNGWYFFHCPGCGIGHIFDQRWAFDGNLDAPSFRNAQAPTFAEAPKFGDSMISQWNEGEVRKVCHFFLDKGLLHFQGDCTHAMAGKTIPLPDGA